MNHAWQAGGSYYLPYLLSSRLCLEYGNQCWTPVQEGGGETGESQVQQAEE